MCAARRTPPESATTRLSRLLTMVPWLMQRQGIDVAEAAAGLGVSEKQLEADLSLLFLCGYGQMPDELIDAQWESGHVYVRNADTIARPLRLGRDEAVTLTVGLRTLLAVPGLGERDAVERALAKLEEAGGAGAEAATRMDVAIDSDVDPSVLADARRGLQGGRRLHLRYLVPSRDESTERDVDPMRLVNLDAHWYLEAWCHDAQDTRLFRLDRVEELRVLDADGTPPEHARQRDLREGVFQPDRAQERVTLRLEPSAAWVADYYPVESVEEQDDGSFRVVLATGDRAWLRRLLLRLGGQGRVIEPVELAQDVTGAAQAALTAYARGSSEGTA